MTLSNYGLKAGYSSRAANTSIESAGGDYWTPRRRATALSYQWHVYQVAADLVRREAVHNVLDVGCGPGDKLAACIAPLAEATGVDQATVIGVARSLHPACRFAAVDLEAPDRQPAGTFDLVLCCDVIEHLLNPDHLLRYIVANCHERSFVLISTVERDVLRGPAAMNSPHPNHVREWNRPELAAYLESAGLRVIEHRLAPAFRAGWSWHLWTKRFGLLRKGTSLCYNQWALCRPAKAA